MTTNTPKAVKDPQRPDYSTHLGILVVSAATLLLEINLTRIFSFTIWYHFAFIVISVALLGFGASGSFLTLWGGLSRSAPQKLLMMSSVGATLGVAIATFVITRVEFSPFQLFSEPRQISYALLYMVVVTIPFFFSGMTVAVALSSYTQRAGSLYFANLIGAGVGCLAFVWVMNLWGAWHVLIICATLFCIGAICFMPRHAGRLTLVLLPVLALIISSMMTTDFRACRDKWMRIMTQLQHGEVIHSKWSALFRTDVVDFGDREIVRGGSWGQLGRGKAYEGPLPTLRYILHDGGAPAVMLNTAESLEDVQFFRHHILGLATQMRPQAKVFVGGVGGGADIMAALANGASQVDGVELDPYTLEIIRDLYGDYVGNICARDDVSVVAGDARGVLQRSGKSYDVIQFTGVDTVAAAASGAYLLSESYLYTTEAFENYFDHLNPGGLISMSTHDVGGEAGKARMIPRFCSVFATALENRGVTNPARCTIVLCVTGPNQRTYGTILGKMEPFTEAETAYVRKFAADEGFYLWHLPGEEIDTVGSEILRFTPAERAAYLKDTYLDLSASTDDKPFFLSFYKWRGVWSHLRVSRTYLDAMGNIVLLGSLVASLLASLILIIVPAYWHVRRQKGEIRLRVSDLVYFSAIGLGFMLFEIPLIQQFVLFLGYPTYSLTVTLFSVLTFAGVGSYLSQRLRTGTALPVWGLFACLAGLVVVYATAGNAALSAMAYLPLPVRMGIAVLVMAPLGLVLGTFFPLGIRDLGSRNPVVVPLAWAANGSCSVISTILAVILATGIGFRNVFVLALLLYLVAALAFQATRREAA